MKAVVLTTARTIPPEPLGQQPDDVQIRFVILATEAVQNALVITLPDGPGARLGDRISLMLQGNAALRMTLRLSPLDRGARFWRAVRRDRRVLPLILDADLLVAADRDANFATWHLARRTGIPAVSGYAAAVKDLQERTAL